MASTSSVATSIASSPIRTPAKTAASPDQEKDAPRPLSIDKHETMLAASSSSSHPKPTTTALADKSSSAAAAISASPTAVSATAPSSTASASPVSVSITTAKQAEEPALSTSPSPQPIDMETFLQILDLDEDSDHEFSRDMVEAYFAQAATTFEDMASAISSADLTKLSELGHFLKGSSAALGVFKVQASCEKIQNFGKNQDQDTDRSLTDAQALKMITGLMPTVKRDFADAEKWLKNWYEKNCTPEP